MKSDIKAIIFDLGNVLMDWDRAYLYRKMFKGEEEKMTYFLDHVCTLEWNAELDKGYPFARAIEELIPKHPKYEKYIRAYKDRWIEMVPGALEETVALMAELKEQGYSLYALSNWAAETFPQVCPHYAFFDWFDEIVLSGDIGVTKPDPGIYQALLNKIPFPPEECVFIDDSLANVQGGEVLGIHGIHFVSVDDLREKLRGFGVEI